MLKVLWCRFRQCLDTFTILLIEASSEAGLFRHLSDYVFGVRNFENTNLWGSFFDSKYLRFNLDFKNGVKNWQKAFCFSDNWIRIGVVKFSLWRTRSFSSAANVLTSSPKILHVNKRHFFQLNWLGGDHWIWKRWYHADMNGAWARLPCSLSNGLLKREFLDIYFHTFSESGTSKIQKVWGSTFFSKRSKFQLDFIKAAKNWEKYFCFWDNCIWIGIVKRSLLRTGYFSSATNVLTSRPKILHVNMRYFFQLSLLNIFPLLPQMCCDEDFKTSWARLPCACRRILWNETF